jgi:IS5 family transposase
MPPKPAASRQISFLILMLGEQRDPRQPLKQLADTLPWSEFEPAYYSAEGRPAKPGRLMVGLLLLKHGQARMNKGY